MDWQTTFYVTGTIFMVLGIILFLGIGISILYLRKKAFDVRNNIVRHIAVLSKEPGAVAVSLGASFLKSALHKFRAKLKGTSSSLHVH